MLTGRAASAQIRQRADIAHAREYIIRDSGSVGCVRWMAAEVVATTEECPFRFRR